MEITTLDIAGVERNAKPPHRETDHLANGEGLFDEYNSRKPAGDTDAAL